MKNYYIMTIRNSSVGMQEKVTVERSRCFIRRYKLYPLQDILVDEKIVTKNELCKYVTTNMAIHLAGLAGANVYFNGNNYRKFTEGR